MRPLPSPCPRLTATVEGAVGVLTLANAAKHNAIDIAMWRALPHLVTLLSSDPDVRVIVLRGDGENFSAGADIAEFDTERSTPAGSRAYEAENVSAFRAIAAAPRPTVAAIGGYCFGAGLGLALSCDLRIAAEDARFAIPAARLGVAYPPAAFASIVAAVGADRAKDLFYTGRRLDAADALAAGLVNRVVPADRLAGELADMARAIAAGAPMTLTAAKRAIDAAAGLPHALLPEQVQALADACFDSADFAEGRSAFRERRTPRFSGK